MPPERESGVDEHRVLVLAPYGRDATLTAGLLEQHGLAARVCPDMETLLGELRRGAGAAVVVEEAFTPASLALASAALAQQPPWSDFPIVVFTARGASASQNLRVLESLAGLGNVTALERPVHPATLVSAARAALRARQRQYQARRALDQRESELRHRDRFLAMLGHELRNPLSAIRHASETLKLRRSVDTPGQRPLSVIERQIGHLTRLVDDLLEVARVTSGKITLQRQIVEIGGLLRAAVEEVVPGEARIGPRLVWDLPAQEVVFDGDPVRLYQVFTNLLTNAFKYTPAVGHVTISLRAESGWAVVRVADTGVGIGRDVLPTIFEPFAQADRTLDRAQGGMGLGLTVVRSLVELHAGRVEVDSEGPGRGSTFTLRLPLTSGWERAVAPRAPSAAAAPPVAGSVQPRHVLLVEDAEDIRESLQELLSEIGHRVEAAADGEMGVKKALTSRPEVALIDIGLPRIDGYEVARRVRAALGPDILLVALTGYGQPEDAARAHAAGFDLHLRKPTAIEEIERLLAGYRTPAPGGDGSASGSGDEPGQDQGVEGDHQADQGGEDDAVLDDGAEDGRFVAHLAGGGR